MAELHLEDLWYHELYGTLYHPSRRQQGQLQQQIRTATKYPEKEKARTGNVEDEKMQS
jgi:hypothetical protein